MPPAWLPPKNLLKLFGGVGGGKPPAPPKHKLRRPFLAAAWEFLRLQFSWAKPIPRCPHLATARKLAVLQRHGGGGGGGGGAAPMPPNQCSRLAAAREFTPAPPKHICRWPPYSCFQKNIEVPHGRSPHVAEAHTPMPPPSRRFFLVSQH